MNLSHLSRRMKRPAMRHIRKGRPWQCVYLSPPNSRLTLRDIARTEELAVALKWRRAA